MKKAGREEVAAYSAVEHFALLSIISKVPDTFNTDGESPPQQAAVYKRMVEESYNSDNVWQYSALHGNFVELYRTFKLGTRNLSLEDRTKKCLSVYEKGKCNH